MKILKATYGGVDCTPQIQAKVNNKTLIIRASNYIIGDTNHGVEKYLELEIAYNDKISNHKIKENELFLFPKQTSNRLGIFYSNNNNPEIYPAIHASLNSIKKSSQGKADIITCMWQHDHFNPFPEFIAWTNTCSHLNQLLQIMQLLYKSREMGQYEYVSFLEHDVLYPEGYFDYPDFEEGKILFNTNFIGINTDGFQPLGQKDKPFHQMTMRFKDAIKHCENILPNALITNSGIIEPTNLIIEKWECKNPAIHINHGRHFTSHFSIYTKDIFSYHEYWGEHKNVWPF